ncbi:RNA-directed DNA polymerase, eukaryota, reverse transcriptase zinc-binding domain protein [Tanacetum coccineum]
MNALFDIGDNKASGPDGYSSVFFKKACNIIRKDVCEAIKDFFLSGQMPWELNATLITLVPKIQTPMKVFDFRPIACCNVVYKCISKIITNRIKSGLAKLVQNNQSAFIPGRVIQDNIMLSQEILRGYGRKNGPKRCAMKIDLQKAYDTVSWSFLETILVKFGFHSRMVKWIMVCVRTVGFSICINGDRHSDAICDNHDLSRLDNQSIERDRLIGIGFVLNFVKFISFTFGDKEMISVIEAVSR